MHVHACDFILTCIIVLPIKNTSLNGSITGSWCSWFCDDTSLSKWTESPICTEPKQYKYRMHRVGRIIWKLLIVTNQRSKINYHHISLVCRRNVFIKKKPFSVLTWKVWWIPPIQRLSNDLPRRCQLRVLPLQFPVSLRLASNIWKCCTSDAHHL